MRDWNPVEMQKLFRERAKQEGSSLRGYLTKFVEDLSQPVHYTTMVRYLEEGSNGPKRSAEKISIYEKMEKEFGIPMLSDSANIEEDREIYIEDRQKKVPEFCQKKLEEAFANILQYIVDAYNGRYTLLFESDYSELLFFFVIYKPCAPNYLCCEIQEFFKNKMCSIKQEAIDSGMIIFEDIGFWYQDELQEGEIADVDDCELAEDYIDNNQEEHKDRVRKFLYDIAEFWEKNVERLYPNGEGQARRVIMQFEEYCQGVENTRGNK